MKPEITLKRNGSDPRMIEVWHPGTPSEPDPHIWFTVAEGFMPELARLLQAKWDECVKQPDSAG